MRVARTVGMVLASVVTLLIGALAWPIIRISLQEAELNLGLMKNDGAA